MNRLVTTLTLAAGLAASSLAFAATTPATGATAAPTKHATAKKCHDAAGKAVKCDKKGAIPNT